MPHMVSTPQPPPNRPSQLWRRLSACSRTLSPTCAARRAEHAAPPNSHPMSILGLQKKDLYLLRKHLPSKSRPQSEKCIRSARYKVSTIYRYGQLSSSPCEAPRPRRGPPAELPPHIHPGLQEQTYKLSTKPLPPKSSPQAEKCIGSTRYKVSTMHRYSKTSVLLQENTAKNSAHTSPSAPNRYPILILGCKQTTRKRSSKQFQRKLPPPLTHSRETTHTNPEIPQPYVSRTFLSAGSTFLSTSANPPPKSSPLIPKPPPPSEIHTRLTPTHELH
jgi:hypothetical protein